MAVGLFAENVGYWELDTDELPAAKYTQLYPAGWRVVSVRPSPSHALNGNDEWVAGEEPPVTRDDVNAERDRRNYLDFTFNGIVYQADQRSQDRLNRARTSALAALMAGAVAGNYRWHGEDTDFFWISKDNTKVYMDAQTVVAFGNSMVAREGLLIAAADALKNTEGGIPGDFRNETYWTG